MMAYRICKSEYAADLSGEGARRAGGRWNSKGVAMIYTAMSRSLCLAELAVHLPLGILPEGFCMVSFSIPDGLRILSIDEISLPATWRSFPYESLTQGLGDQFVRESASAILKVPSAVVPEEKNYLLNPAHPEFGEIKIAGIEHYNFDERLFLRR